MARFKTNFISTGYTSFLKFSSCIEQVVKANTKNKSIKHPLKLFKINSPPFKP